LRKPSGGLSAAMRASLMREMTLAASGQDALVPEMVARVLFQ
jgi:hypothetical protein